MEPGAITSYFDVAQLVLYAFWLFFAGLIIYLRREDRREGYPAESEITGKAIDPGVVLTAPNVKTFLWSDGTTAQAPDPARADTRPVAARPVDGYSGAPMDPIGDPMLAAVGPGAYAERDDKPDMTVEGEPKIVPLKVATDFFVVEEDPDPRGMPVIGADGRVAGNVSEVWVDRAEPQIRYLELGVEADVEVDVEVQVPIKNAGEGEPQTRTEIRKETRRQMRQVLLPIGFALISRGKRQVSVQSILAAQFANVPGTKKSTEVTRLEEDMISAYYAGGTLYATPDRVEPII